MTTTTKPLVVDHSGNVSHMIIPMQICILVKVILAVSAPRILLLVTTNGVMLEMTSVLMKIIQIKS